MLQFVCFNHKIKPASKASLPAASAAAFYGRGVFTTIAVTKGEPLLWGKHWRRLKNDAARLNLDLSNFRKEEVENALAETIAANNLRAGRARITFFDQSLKGIWSFASNAETSFFIVAAEKRIVVDNLRLTLSAYPLNSLSPLAGVKSCSYLENLLALENAKDGGFEEAIRLNEKGEVVSACLANVFWVKNGEIFTAPPGAGALPGTTREFVLENFPVSERKASVADLNNADEVFLTSAGIGTARVDCIDARKYVDAAVFDRVKKRIAEFFDD